VFFIKKYKLIITFIIFFTIISSGILIVNSRYTRSNGKFVDNEFYTSKNLKDIKISENALYNEINLSKDGNSKLRLYFNFEPFDFRLSIGNHILYINEQAIKNIISKLSFL
jgi:hypothetical protein